MKENKHKSVRARQNASLANMIEKALHQYFRQLDGQPPCDLYDMFLAQVEPPLLKAVLAYTQGNKLRAAELLNLSRTTLNTKLKKYQLDLI